MTLTTARRATIASAVLGLVGLAVAALPSTAGATARTSELTQNVVIADNHFTPNQIGLPDGGSVVWTNTDDVAHNVESAGGPVNFGTGNEVLKNGQSYKFTFTKDGVYRFVSTLNGNFSGTVTVGEGARTSATDEDERPNGGALAPYLPHVGSGRTATPAPTTGPSGD